MVGILSFHERREEEKEREWRREQRVFFTLHFLIHKVESFGSRVVWFSEEGEMKEVLEYACVSERGGVEEERRGELQYQNNDKEEINCGGEDRKEH